MKLSFLRKQSFQPEFHRYSQATFHEGTHRHAPGDSTPWRDISSPINRLKGWWISPAAKGSVVAAWSVTMVLGTYCYSIQKDAKGTYLLNNALLRRLNEESRRADVNEQRSIQLQSVAKQYISANSTNTANGLQESSSHLSKDSPQSMCSVNYELELIREKLRSENYHKRNTELVEEMTKVRKELAASRAENNILLTEVKKNRDRV